MFGLSPQGKSQIRQIVEDLFDSLALKFLGNHPKLQNKKFAIFSSEPNYGLAHLFIQAMGNNRLNPVEDSVLKGLLDSSYSYIESAKQKSMVSLSEKIDGMTKEANMKGTKISQAEVEKILEDEMGKIKTDMSRIVVSETTKTKNLGATVNITRMSASIGDTDPSCYFIVRRDEHTCQYCIKNHLHPDGRPKVFKMRELSFKYLSLADRKAGLRSCFGQHPFCRCQLVYIGKSFTFKNNRLEYHSENFDEHAFQQEKYKK